MRDCFIRFFYAVSVLFLLSRVTCFAQTSATAGTPTAEKFRIEKIQTDGNTVLTAEEIASVLAPYEGKESDLMGLRRAASDLADLYHKKGYGMARVYVPVQAAGKGVFVITVNEGRVGNVIVNGNRAYSKSFFEFLLSPAIEKGILRTDRLEKQVLLMNEFTDVHARVFLNTRYAAGYEAVDVLVQVQDSLPVHETIEYNDFGNRLSGRNQGSLDLSLANLTGGDGDVADLKPTFQWPSRQNPVWQSSFTALIAPNGDKLGFSYSNADVKLGQELTVLDVRGSALNYGITYSRPLVRSNTESSNFTGAIYSKDVSNFVFASSPLSRDKLREIALSYSHSWMKRTYRDTLSVTVTRGLGHVLGAMDAGDPLASRAGVDDSFTKMSGSAMRLLKVFSDSFLIVQGSAQYAFSPLSTSEQFSIGGPYSVRAYTQAEILGDSGWFLGVELRKPLTAATARNQVQGAIFIETAYSTLRNPAVGETPKSHLTGVGFGFRAGLGITNLRLDLGFPIDPPTNATKQSPILQALGTVTF